MSWVSTSSAPAAFRPAPSRVRAAAMLAGVAACLLLVWSRVLGFDIRRDELMFVPPGALLEDMALYRDFFFNHVPYGAWIFRGAERLFGDLGLLTSARIAVCAAWLLLVAAIWLSVRRLSGSAGLAAVCVLSLMTSEALLNQTGMAATNNLLPLALSAAAAGLFLVATVDGPPRFVPLFLAGFCLAAAAATKVSAVALIPPMLLGAFVLPAGLSLGQRVSRVVAPLTLGGLVGGAPALVILATDPARVLAHVVGFHTGPHVTWWEINAASEPGLALGLAGKVQLAHGLWLGGAALVLVVVLLFLAVLARREPRSTEVRAITESRALWITAAMIAAAACMAFVPSPGFPQYFAPPLVLLPFLPALAMRRLGAAGRDQSAPVLLAAAIAMTALGAPRLLPAATVWLDPGASVPARSAEAGAALRARLEAEGLDGDRVATLMPIYPLEGGLAVYPEFATGPFAYRIAEVTPPDLARHYVMAGPDDLAALFAEHPPGAILTGFAPELEQPFLSWAEAQGYRLAPPLGITDRYGTAVLHLAPTSAASPPQEEVSSP